jgi:hypothetical protein
MRVWPAFLAILWAQDTIRALAYNILNYGQTPGYCQTACKDIQLRTLIPYIKPDLIVFNEIAPYPAYVRRLLDSVLNIQGISYWQSAPYPSNLVGDRLSMVFYDSRRFAYQKQELITTQGNLRDVRAFHLYYQDPDLSVHQDTVFVVVIATHLKAGNTASDANTRAQAALAMRNYIQALPPNRQRWVLNMGDHNLYGASEAAYQRLNEALIDPGPSGEWDDNSAYAFYHTQSTRLSALADGGSSGGLNSRFDFIFFSPACTSATAKARYIPGSLRAIGQDGQHFKKGLLDAPPVVGYPQSVLNALYAVSDHLPVVADFALSVRSPLSALAASAPMVPTFSVEVSVGYLVLSAQQTGTFSIYNGLGQHLWRGTLQSGETALVPLERGLYWVQAQSEAQLVTRRILLP